MSDELKDLGTQMANVMFNMAQMEGERISRRSVEIMDGLRRKWDAAIRATPSPSTAPIAQDERTPIAYIAPHVMESLRAGCHVATTLTPKPDGSNTEAVYGG